MIAVLTDKWSTEKNPQHITDAEAVAKIISQNINLSEEKVLDYLTRESDQVEFGAAGNNLSYQTVSRDRKSTRLNSSHVSISYAVFCLKKKKKKKLRYKYGHHR